MADDGHQGKGQHRIQNQDYTYFVGLDIMNGQGKQSVGKQGVQSQEQQYAANPLSQDLRKWLKFTKGR